jgi:drug/metabolite transporter (DMT)-like permease
MRLIALTVLTMAAFAANSVLNRAALTSGGIDAVSFGTIRLWSGAVMLLLLGLVLRHKIVLGGPGRVAGVAGLVLYIYGFSVAYVTLDAGLGALILFGTVQVTMFGGSLIGGERPPLLRWLGAVLAFGGLVWLLWPGGAVEISLIHGGAMVLAGVGWGVYSLAGRLATDPLLATGANFALAAPIGLGLGLLMPVSPEAIAPEVPGILLAVLAGAMTSGLGYALWYHVLPQIKGSVAAVAQLTVPVIAMAGGMAFLGEALTAQFTVAAAIVLSGVALSVSKR